VTKGVKESFKNNEEKLEAHRHISIYIARVLIKVKLNHEEY
jgi:hypothetical protein